MITGIAIENFKGIRERVEIELRPITLLFGPNSAGKSSILHALQLAHEVFLRNNPNPDETLVGGGMINLGGFRTFVHNRSQEKPVRISFQIKLDDPDIFFAGGQMEAVPAYLSNAAGYEGVCDCFGHFSHAEIAIELRSNDLRGAYVSSFLLTADREPLAEITVDRPGGQQVVRLNLEHRSLLTVSDGEEAYGIDSESAHPDLLKTALLKICLNALSDLVQEIPKPEGMETPWHSFILDEMPSVIPTNMAHLPFAKRALDSEEYKQAEIRLRDELEARSVYPFLAEVFEGIGQLVTIPLAEVMQFLESFRYLGPIREVPRRSHESPSLADASRWASGLGAWDRLETADATFISEVNDWLGDEERLNTGFVIHRKHFKELDLSDPLVVQLLTGRAFDEAESSASLDLKSLPTRSRLVISPVDSSLELRPNDLGVGISQVVPVIVTALDGPEGFVAMEQPELHLHPKLQAELGDLFIESALNQPRHSMLLETHSEHLILRLLRRIREAAEGDISDGRHPLTPDDLGVYFVEGGSDGMRATRIRVDTSGEFIDRWPRGFFCERAKELF